MRIQRDHSPPKRARRHGGFALLTGLIFLVAMSVLGVTMMSVTRLETLMAGGAREASIAFQAAEAALRRAEANIEATASPPPASSAQPGMLGTSDPEPDFFETDPTASDYAWNDAQSIGYSTDPNCPTATACYPEVPEQPRVIAKYVGDVTDEAAKKQLIAIGGYAQGGEIPVASTFRVTARGTSRDGSAETILQSYFGKIY
jgi:type IV pilus assembly protein PilX